MSAGLEPPERPVMISRYGDHPSQLGELYTPSDAPRGVAIVLHGGFWRAAYGCDLMHPLCRDLTARGWAAWNVEYRRLGEGGGWPATFEDVRAAIDLLGTFGLPERPVVTIGHSAGGQLALWAATHPRVTHAVSQAGILDLESAAALGLSRDVVHELVGGSEQLYRELSPQALVPLPVPQLVVHGEADDVVPMTLSRGYVEAAVAAGGDVELVTLPGCGHYEHLDPGSPAWATVVAWLAALVGEVDLPIGLHEHGSGESTR